MNKLILYLVSLSLFCSCAKYEDVDVKLPFKSKLVSVSFIQHGSDRFQVSLTRTTPVFDKQYLNEPNYITNALVTLHTPDESYALTYNHDNQSYEVIMPSETFEPGKVYGLSVQQGGETITGSTKLPELVTSFASVVLDSVMEGELYTYIARISCGIKEPGTHNLQLAALMVYEDSSSMYMISENTLTRPVTPLKSGQQITRTFRSAFSSEFIRPVRIDVIAILCDEPYTKYINSTNDIDWNSAEVPLGEPYITSGNMSNNIGVIGAYRHLPPYSVYLK